MSNLNSSRSLSLLRKWTGVTALLLFATAAHAQNTAGGLQNLVTQIKLIANIIVIAFAGGSPAAMRNVLYTIIIALFWFGFNYFVDDIASSLGGSGADQYNR
jgi:hypothetical protein